MEDVSIIIESGGMISDHGNVPSSCKETRIFWTAG
jgi:hypothetical protein